MDLSTERWHFIGIGGSGMSALASALIDLGAPVSGSDLTLSDATRALEARGAHIVEGHDPANIDDATQVVLTGAVRADNPELKEAQRRGLPVVKRAVLLGRLMDLRRGVAVAGTHGKTTTSAMIAWVLAKTGRDPSYMVGGSIRGLGPGGHWGTGSALVAEADEYDSSFLQLRPEISVITNIEADHLDYYGTIEAIYAAFGQFASNTRRGGLLVICADDPGASQLARGLLESATPFRVQLYGKDQGSLWHPLNPRRNDHGGVDYEVTRDRKKFAAISLSVPGAHNVLNSLAAFAACVELGIEPDEAAQQLGTYLGAGRRFEVRGEVAGVTVVDDYAHHPSEIAATVEAARGRYPGRRLVVIFQPHTYTRTRDFLDDFASVLGKADRVIVSEIFASRERDTLGLSSRQLVERIAGAHAEYAPDLREAAQMALDDVRAGDVLLTMGAGDVWKAGEDVLAALAIRDEEEEREPAASAVAASRHIPLASLEESAGFRLESARGPAGPSISFATDLAAELQAATGLKVTRDEAMSKHDSLRVGGPATLYVGATTVSELVGAVQFAREHKLPHIVIGNGTNLLVGDYGIDGLVIHNRTRNISHEILDERTSLWHVDSGVLFSRLARLTCEQGWTGLEWSNSVPGSVGGGVVSNAGAHGKELKDDLVSIEVLTESGEVETWPVAALSLGYRTSRFKAHGKRDLVPREVILRARLTLYRDEEHDCEARMRTYLEERQAKQPQGKSAGSTFKNPPGSSAGYLVEQVGLKGHQYGQAQFSPKHANFMMNLGGATASDVLHLMRLARERVLEQFGIELEPEIELVGDE